MAPDRNLGSPRGIGTEASVHLRVRSEVTSLCSRDLGAFDVGCSPKVSRLYAVTASRCVAVSRRRHNLGED
jgi:hypothetical protein